MNKDEQATTTLELAGQRLTLRQLNDEDLVEYVEWVKGLLREDMAFMIRGLPTQHAEVVLKHAYDQITTTTTTSGATVAKMGSLEGISYMLFVMARSAHPELTYERCRELVFNAGPDKAAEVSNTLLGMNESAAEAEPHGSNRKQRRSTKR